MRTIGKILIAIVCVILFLIGLESGEDGPPDCDC